MRTASGNAVAAPGGHGARAWLRQQARDADPGGGASMKVTTMTRAMRIGAVGIAAVLGTAAAAPAQTGSTATAPSWTVPVVLGEQRQVAGTIRMVDATQRVVVVDDGTQLLVPETLPLPREVLRPGAAVRAVYEVRAGWNVVTSIEVRS
jgi:hypothetical protein